MLPSRSKIFSKAIVLNILSTNPFPFCFYFVLFDGITDFELDLYNISSPWSQVRTQHFCLFAVWPASILVLPQVSKFCFPQVVLSYVKPGNMFLSSHILSPPIPIVCWFLNHQNIQCYLFRIYSNPYCHNIFLEFTSLIQIPHFFVSGLSTNC